MVPSNRKGVDHVGNVKQPDEWQGPSKETKTRFYDISKNNPQFKETVAALTEDQRDEWIDLLVQAVFEIANKDWRKYTAVYEASVIKCFETRVLDAGVWSEWGGQRDVRAKLSEMHAFSRLDGYLHVLPAPTLAAIVAVKVLRDIQTKDNDDEATVFLENLFQFDYLGFAIDNYKPKVKFIATDVAWKVDPDVKEPQPMKDQPAQNVKDNMAFQEAKRKVKERARREQGKAQLEKPKSKTAEPAKRTSQAKPQARQVTPKPNSKTDEPAKRASQPKPQAQARPQGNATRQSNPKNDSQTRDPVKNLSKLPSADANRPDNSRMPTGTQPIFPPHKTVEVRIRRDEALATVGKLMKQVIGNRNDSEESPDYEELEALNEQLRQAVTKQIVIVLPQGEKDQLFTWATCYKHNEIRQWVRAAKEDKTEHTWTEEVVNQDDRMAALEETNKELLQRVNGLEKPLSVILELVKSQHESLKKVIQKTTDIERSVKTMALFMTIGKKRSHDDAFDNENEDKDGLA